MGLEMSGEWMSEISGIVVAPSFLGSEGPNAADAGSSAGRTWAGKRETIQTTLDAGYA